MKPFVILGARGYARVIHDLLDALGHRVLGHVGHMAQQPDDYRQVSPYLGADELLLARDPSTIDLANGVGSIAPGGARARLFERYRSAGFRFPSLVHPQAAVSPKAVLHEGVQILAGAVVQPGANIGSNTIVNIAACVDHDCSIGKHVHLAPGVCLSGDVTIGDDVQLGTGACVRNGIKIVSACLVGVGAAVVADLSEPGVYRGVPARRAHDKSSALQSNYSIRS